jgi:hypothetical protein
MLNIRYFKEDSGGKTKPITHRTPNNLCCQSPKSPNRLDHLVLVPWSSNIEDWAIAVKDNLTRVGKCYRIAGLFRYGMSAMGELQLLSLLGRQFTDAV